MDSLLGRILKLIFGSIVVGLFSGLIIPRVINAFSSDGSFELLELWLTFLIIIITTNILVFLVRFLTHHLSRIIAIKPHIDCNFTQFKFLSIPGVLTGIIPMGGGLFGGSGNEPIWEFVLLGIVGSLFWSIPLFLWLFKDDQIDPYVPPVATATESEQPTFLVGEAIRFGWNTMKSNLGFFIGILIVNVLIGVVPYVIERLVSSIPIRIVVGISFRVLNMVIWMGLIRIALKLYDNKGIGFTDLFSCFPLFLNYLFGSILYGLIVFGGMILLIIPGIIWAMKFQFYSYFIVDKGFGPIEALKRSSLITEGVKWNLFLFGLLLALINVLGALCLLVGLFATIPTAMIAVSFVYRKLAVTDVKETD